MGMIKEKLVVEIVGEKGSHYASFEADTAVEADALAGGWLSGHTYEDGCRVSSDMGKRVILVRQIGPITIEKTLVEEVPLAE